MVGQSNLAFQLHFLTTRLESTARRITPYHQGSLRSEARLSSSTLSRQGNLTSSPPRSSYYADKAFLSCPILCKHSLCWHLLLKFCLKIHHGSTETHQLQQSFHPERKRERENRTRRYNSTWPQPFLRSRWVNKHTPVTGTAVPSRAFGMQFCSWQPQTMITKPCHCPLLLYFWAQEKWELFHSEFKLRDSGLILVTSF